MPKDAIIILKQVLYFGIAGGNRKIGVQIKIYCIKNAISSYQFLSSTYKSKSLKYPKVEKMHIRRYF